MKAGFIGLGHLGKAMAKRLITEGVSLTVWNRTKEKAADLGVPVAETPAAVVSAADIVFLNLFDSEVVWSVLTGVGGISAGDCKGKIIIDTTTNHFEDVIHFHEIMADQEGYYLEAPVLGSVLPASTGSLTVLVSGEKTAYESALPLISMIGKNIFFLDKPALATKMKLINNLVLGSLMTALAEATVFAEASGIDKATAIDILGAGAGNSAVLNAKKEKLLKEDFSPQFTLSLIYKDLHYLQDLARSLRRPLFSVGVAKELYGMGFSKDMEDLDISAIYKVLKDC
ncbi:MAG: NAD(P)-dependent oxidoreductase [Nitrospiraceae bacterium]|nr:NAD(P)-dependent oxidoreductase [Nitrospiraceae bacterium]